MCRRRHWALQPCLVSSRVPTPTGTSYAGLRAVAIRDSLTVEDVGKVVTLHEDQASAEGYVWGYMCRSTCDDVVRLRGVMNGQLSRDSSCRATAP